MHALNKLLLSWQFQCSSQKLQQQTEQSKNKQEKEKKREPTQWDFIHCIVKQKKIRSEKKPNDSYFDIEHTLKIIVMGNLWLTCWLPIPLVLASIPVCGEILSLGRRTATHSSVCASRSLFLCYLSVCLCASMLFHSSSQRYFSLLRLFFCTPNFPHSFPLLIPFHSLFKCITIVSRLST